MRWRMQRGVLEQIDDNLLYLLIVTANGRQVLGNVDAYLTAIGERLHACNGIRNELMQILRPLAKPQVARLDARRVQEVANEPFETVRLLFNLGKKLGTVGVAEGSVGLA